MVDVHSLGLVVTLLLQVSVMNACMMHLYLYQSQPVNASVLRISDPSGSTGADLAGLALWRSICAWPMSSLEKGMASERLPGHAPSISLQEPQDVLVGEEFVESACPSVSV